MKTRKGKAASDGNTSGPLRRKKTARISGLIIAILLLSSSVVYAWTITVSGTIFENRPYSSQAGPFGENSSLVGLPYTLTLTTNPALNGYDGSDQTNHYTVGGTVSPYLGAPYTLKFTINGIDFIQTEYWPASNQASLTSTQFFQQVYSNGCDNSLRGLCVEVYVYATSATPILQTLDFNQTLRLTDRNINPAPISRMHFGFRNGPYTNMPLQQLVTLEGSIDDLSVRRDR